MRWSQWTAIDRLKADVQFGARQLVQARSFAFAAIATLGIGIGATAAVGSVLEAVVLRPFPFSQPDRVVDVHPNHNGAPVATASNLEFATWRALSRTFADMVATSPQLSLTFAHGDEPEVVTGARTSWALSNVLGVAPELGRGFTPADDQPGAPKVVLLSHKLWVRAYNANRGVLGLQVRLDDESYSIIGVLPASLDPVTNGTEVWVPLALSSTDLLDFRARNLQLIGRLAPGVTRMQAAAAVDAAEQRLAAQYPLWGTGYTGDVSLYSKDMIGDLRTRLFVLFGAVAFVFLIACVNVANLVLARGTARIREMGIRTALGATRRRLVAQLLTESIVLWIVAAVIGIGLAAELLPALVAISPAGVPRLQQARVDGPVLLVTLVISALSSVLVGLLPAARLANWAQLGATLREEGRGTGQGRVRERARTMLVAAEIALAMTLLTATGLLIRTAWDLDHVDPGFDRDHVLTAQVVLPTTRYGEIGTAVQTYRAIRDVLDRTSGVQSAALTTTLPLTTPIRAGIGAEGRPTIDGERLLAMVRAVSPDYFAAMKVRLLGGRDFLQTDNANAPNVAVINETLARKLWPGQDAVGKRMEGMDPSHQHFMQIIAVVADPRDVSLAQAPEPEFYIPFEQTPPPLWAGIQGQVSLVVRTVSNPASMEREVRHAVDAIDPSLPVANVMPMSEIVRTSTSTSRFNTIVLSILATIALVLASVGVYGVVTYAVSQRTREIGLRMALGATPAAIARLIARGALAPTLAGAAVGAILSAFTTGLLRDQLFGVEPHDPAILAMIVVLLVGVSLLAAYVPTRRALRMSATKALAG